MRVTLRGWSRNHGEHLLVDGSVMLAGADLSWGRVGLRETPTGVALRCGIEVHLTGRYVHTLTLDDAEIAALFWRRFGGRSLVEVKRALEHAAGVATRTRQRKPVRRRITLVVRRPANLSRIATPAPRRRTRPAT